jgi:hypothetical protein
MRTDRQTDVYDVANIGFLQLPERASRFSNIKFYENL